MEGEGEENNKKEMKNPYLCGELLTRRLSSGRLAGSLLGTGHLTLLLKEIKNIMAK